MLSAILDGSHWKYHNDKLMAVVFLVLFNDKDGRQHNAIEDTPTFSGIQSLLRNMADSIYV